MNQARRKKIVELLETQGTVTNDELMQTFQISIETVRRDLGYLEKCGLLERVYGCKRGVTYAEAEYSNPVRILTTTVKVEGKANELLPVRSSVPVPQGKLFECMEIIKKTSAKLPVKRYDVIVKDICGTGVDIVATKDIF
jgi:CxxC motif-containing protein